MNALDDVLEGDLVVVGGRTLKRSRSRIGRFWGFFGMQQLNALILRRFKRKKVLVIFERDSRREASHCYVSNCAATHVEFRSICIIRYDLKLEVITRLSYFRSWESFVFEMLHVEF